MYIRNSRFIPVNLTQKVFPIMIVDNSITSLLKIGDNDAIGYAETI